MAKIRIENTSSKWLADLRLVSKAWALGYEPADYVTPMDEVRNALVNHINENFPQLTNQWSVYCFPETKAQGVWFYVRETVRAAFKSRGYMTTPNIKDPDSQFAGAKDLLLQLPTEYSTKEHISLSIDLLKAKKQRNIKMAENAQVTVARLDDQIRLYTRWLGKAYAKR